MSRLTPALGAAVLLLAGACVWMAWKYHADGGVIAAQAAQIAGLERTHGRAPPPARYGETNERSVRLPAPPAEDHDDEDETRTRAELMQMPEFTSALLTQQTADARRQLRGLRNWMPLSDQQFNDLIHLQAEKAVELQTIRAADKEPPDATYLRLQQQDLDQQYEPRIRQLLGEENHARWREWQQAAAARGWIRTMNDQLPMAQMLPAENIPRVATALAEAERRLNGQAGELRQRNESLMAAVKPYLSAAQQKVLRETLEVQGPRDPV